MVGIVSYGYYTPSFRIKIADIAGMWGKNATDVSSSLQVKEKAVSSQDEDALTMAYESASQALQGISIDRKKIGGVFFGTESPPYAVNPSSTILAEFLGIEGHYLASDLQFACKAATGAIITASGLIASGRTPYTLVVASDKATAKPHDALEYTASSGSVSLLLGKKNPLLEIVDMESFSSDTPDFWRREGIRYPSHGGRFTGKPSYFHHIMNSSQTILKRCKIKPSQFAHAVFHMPNGKFPRQVASFLGFTLEQIKTSLVIESLGNSYTASSLMGLVAVLEIAKPGEYIFLASYGSGAGSDAFIFRVTKEILNRRKVFQQKINEKKYIDYQTYLRYMNII
ncbi:hydroxymethylglutaryl-CoA synthase [Candidatus Roizmanbacteria bacterium]|nr:hydroxymethylglutaryl-CoA synthase [Candidatus Roizmanbacteria bacterium]